MKQPAYEYKAKFISNHDADTCTLAVDVGFGITIKEIFRLFGINAPEMKGDTLEESRRGRDVLKAKLEGQDLIVRTHKAKEKFGRYLCEIQIPGESMTVNDWLVANGYAVEYMRE